MSISQKIFTVCCALLALCFVLASVWQWYGFLRTTRSYQPYSHLDSTSVGQSIKYTSAPKTKDVDSTDKEYDQEEEVQEEVVENNITHEDEVVDEQDVPELELTRAKEMPKEIYLAVPFTSQAPEKNWDQPWQDACEEAAVLMVDAYYKKYGVSPLFAKGEMQKMVHWEEAQGWGTSIPASQVQELYTYFSDGTHDMRVVYDPTITQIKTYLSLGNPVIALARGKSLKNPYFSNGGPEYHALVIIGYTEDGFVTHDPGTSRGAGFVYSFETLMGALHDWNNGNVQSGEPVILVLE
ncbi:MAG: hypothetical protein HOJ25_00755 [Candidatus Magasanikbacteria bacterium]|nr:hypothetical protein [Candidatus Magasanikbacteria bacterium]